MDSVASSGKDFVYDIWQVTLSLHISVLLQAPTCSPYLPMSCQTLWLEGLMWDLCLSLSGQLVHAQSWCSCRRGELELECILFRVVVYEFGPTLT